MDQSTKNEYQPLPDRMLSLVSHILILTSIIGCQQKAHDSAVHAVAFETIEVSAPILDKSHPDLQGNNYGFEGGRIVEIGDTLHWITAEMNGDPKLVRMRIAHWKSFKGADKWQRVSTLYESSGEFTGKDTRAALWGPMPIFDNETQLWNLFYVSYRAKPNSDSAWYLNHDGKIWRSISEKKGFDGIGGPYRNDTLVLEYGSKSDPWEGLQGTDSFFPFKFKDAWLAFYGSAQTQYVPCRFWGIGLAKAPSLAGPWVRVSNLNPVDLNSKFAENPVVVPLGKDTLIALVDGGHINNNFGFTTSTDGVTWTNAEFIPLDKVSNKWWTLMRTPLCLIEDEQGHSVIYFTAFTKDDFACLGKATFTVRKNHIR